MKKLSLKTIGTCVLSLSLLCLMASCGTQIQMTEAIPAKVNFGRDTTMYIGSINSLDSRIAGEIGRKLTEDGYYKLPMQRISDREAYMTISGTKLVPKESNYFQLKTHVSIYAGGQNLYQRSFLRGKLLKNEKLDFDIDEISTDVVHDISPHEKDLYVRVRGSKENPSVELGAKACKAGNWAQGEAYAKQALQQKPDDPEALFLMGVIERKKMNYAQSTAYFTRALAVKPSGKYRKAISKNKVMEQNDKYTMQQLAGE